MPRLAVLKDGLNRHMCPNSNSKCPLDPSARAVESDRNGVSRASLLCHQISNQHPSWIASLGQGNTCDNVKFGVHEALKRQCHTARAREPNCWSHLQDNQRHRDWECVDSKPLGASQATCGAHRRVGHQNPRGTRTRVPRRCAANSYSTGAGKSTRAHNRNQLTQQDHTTSLPHSGSSQEPPQLRSTSTCGTNVRKLQQITCTTQGRRQPSKHRGNASHQPGGVLLPDVVVHKSSRQTRRDTYSTGTTEKLRHSQQTAGNMSSPYLSGQR